MQLAWAIIEAVFLGSFLYGLLKVRTRLGILPIVVCIGALQYLQVVLAIGLYAEILPGLVASPGSVVIFPATLLGVLLVYIVEGSETARRLIYGLLLSNILLSVLTLAVSVHARGPDVVPTVPLPDEIFLQNPRVLLVGTLALFADTLLVVVVYEALARIEAVAVRIWLAMAAALILDSLLFATGAFIEDPRYLSILGSGVAAKLLLGVPYAITIGVWARWAPIVTHQDDGAVAVLELRTYRQRYLQAQTESLRDALTGLRNRRALDGDLARAVAEGRCAVLLVDVDHFKRINDALGHAAGDEVLTQVADTLDRSLRAGDSAYRYGGEEFAVLLPGADLATGVRVAERARAALADLFAGAPLPVLGGVTVTIGVARAPDEADDPAALLALADARLYAGKRAGRDRVVFTDDATSPAADSEPDAT